MLVERQDLEQGGVEAALAAAGGDAEGDDGPLVVGDDVERDAAQGAAESRAVSALDQAAAELGDRVGRVLRRRDDAERAPRRRSSVVRAAGDRLGQGTSAALTISCLDELGVRAWPRTRRPRRPSDR